MWYILLMSIDLRSVEHQSEVECPSKEGWKDCTEHNTKGNIKKWKNHVGCKGQSMEDEAFNGWLIHLTKEFFNFAFNNRMVVPLTYSFSTIKPIINNMTL